MATRGGRAEGGGRREPGSGTGRRLDRLRVDGSAVLAACLTAVMLLSLLAVPIAGAPPPDAGPSEGNSNGNSGGGGGGGGDAGGSTGGSGGDGGGDGGATGADEENGAGGSDAGDSGSEEKDGPSKGSDAGEPGTGANGGNGDGGPPDHSNAGGNGDGGNGGPPGATKDDSRGGGPSVSVSTGRPSGAGDGAADGRSDEPSPSSVVEVSVGAAEAGEDVSVDVSPPSVQDDEVAFDGVSVTVKRDGGFTMRVTNSRDRLPGSPEFDPEEAAEPLGHVRLDHSITNEEVEDVSFDFRVSKARLRETGTDFEDVALYRYADGEWTELPTAVVGETATHYLLSADSPGMSEFAVGAKRPDFDAYWADVDDGSVDVGETVTVSGRVTNHGGADGIYDARLVVDGEVVDERSITIAAGGTRQVNFRTAFDRSGARGLSINGVSAGEVTVSARRGDERADSVERGLSVVLARLLDVGHALGIAPPPSPV